EERLRTLAPEELPVVQGVEEDLEAKTREMRDSVSLQLEGRPEEARAMVKQALGLYQMFAISQALDNRRSRECERFETRLAEWEQATRANFLINLGSMLFTVALLLVVGLLATRDLRRRETFATQLVAQIDERTAELQDLSRHMS